MSGPQVHQLRKLQLSKPTINETGADHDDLKRRLLAGATVYP